MPIWWRLGELQCDALRENGPFYSRRRLRDGAPATQGVYGRMDVKLIEVAATEVIVIVSSSSSSSGAQPDATSDRLEREGGAINDG